MNEEGLKIVRSTCGFALAILLAATAASAQAPAATPAAAIDVASVRPSNPNPAPSNPLSQIALMLPQPGGRFTAINTPLGMLIIALLPRCFVLPAVSVVALGIAACQGSGQSEPGGWRACGGDARKTKYSPLAEIDAENAKELRVAWRWELPDNEVGRRHSGLHLTLFEDLAVRTRTA